MSHCVVGDVHGEYDALLNLVSKTPLSSELIFVGDLIDRGDKSAHVVRFVRKHKLACVKGNHEAMMIEFGSAFIKSIENHTEIEQDNMWLKHGGKETLLSYGLVSIVAGKLVAHPFIREFIFQFKDDIAWMKRLPIYLTLDEKHHSGRDIVISHSAIAGVWKMRHSIEFQKKFSEKVLWGRLRPIDQEPIFNIFGHTPQQYTADMQRHYVNIDTGCYMKTETGFGLLSAYCVESGEVYSSSDLSLEKAM